MSESMPTIPTQSTFTYPNPNSSASPSFTQDDTSDSFIPEPTQPIPSFTQTAFSQPVFSQPIPTFTQPAVHFQQTQPTQTNQTSQQYPNNVQSQQFQQFQTASISANNAKFPYLEKDKYEIWAMKMEYWIQNADHNLWRIVQQGNSPKRLGKDAKGNTIVHPPVSLDEHVAERKNRTLIEAARTMLADSKLPTMFWTEAVSTACYVLNKVPQIGHLKPFGCQVTILNTSDYLGKFEGKADECYLVGYAPNSKAYRGIGHEWYFDLDYLTDSLGYTRFKTDKSAGSQETNINAVLQVLHQAMSAVPSKQYPNNVQSQQFQQFQTATISANNAKFPYLEKEKYEIWAMKMECWIQNVDHNLWRIVQQGNSPKRLGKDA
ncbi:putative ribonuclease H-like domain-containing protein, partial [Tanacetum coccineum]